MSWFSTVVVLFALGRMAIGLAPFLAPGPGAALLGFPAAHDTPTSRLMARLFGVRDFGLGVLALAALHGEVELGFALLFNAAMDAGDVASIAIPLVRRQGIDQAAGLSLAVALPAALGWLALYAVRP
jgi:hypothetical protein